MSVIQIAPICYWLGLYVFDLDYFAVSFYFKGTGHFFETLFFGSVPSTDHSEIFTFLIKFRFYMPVPA